MSDSSDLEILEEKPKTNVIELDGSSCSSSSQLSSPSNDDKKAKKSKNVKGNKPTGAECLARCKEFAKVTNTDTALAMFYLQDNDWDLEKGLNTYFKATQNNNSKVVACFDVDKLNEDEKDKNSDSETSQSEAITSKPIPKKPKLVNSQRKRKSDGTTESEDSVESTNMNNKSKDNNSSISNYDADYEDTDYEGLDKSKDANNCCLDDSKEATPPSKHFKLLSWNIDGLDGKNVQTRAAGVVATILKEQPDVVFFQEVVPENEAILVDSLSSIYEFTSGNLRDFYGGQQLNNPNPKDYYTMILSKKKTCVVVSKDLICFENTMMNRNLLKINLVYRKMINICAMTAHLESTKEFAVQRIAQLKKCLNYMQEQDSKTVCFFGGDLNIRDSEIESIGGLPKNISDVWEVTGSRKECLYTWDCSRNTNLTMNGKFKPKCRFDRLYYRPAKAENETSLTLMPVYFELEGLTRLKNCGRFCSDHWAIQCYCELEQNKNF